MSYPSLSHNVVVLVGFDSDGAPQIKVEIPAGRLTPAVERWIMEFVRSEPAPELRR